jgi:hypothetical protein
MQGFQRALRAGALWVFLWLIYIKDQIMQAAASISLKTIKVPAHQVPSPNIRVELINMVNSLPAQPPKAVTDSDLNVSFSDVPDGSYKMIAMRISTAGEPMGTISETSPFDIVNMHDVTVPDVITVTLS